MSESERKSVVQSVEIETPVGSPLFAPSYLGAVAAPLEQLEKDGYLIPYSRSEVQDFQGMRIAGRREPVLVVILRVVTEASAPLGVAK